MLVLSRKANEVIYIGDDIKLTVNRISGNRVTIGIEAPNSFHIVRGELAPQSRSADQSERKVESFVSAM